MGNSGINRGSVKKPFPADSGMNHVPPVVGPTCPERAVSHTPIDFVQISSDPQPREIPLTLRELEVLRGIAVGRRNYEIAQELFISTRTVEKHIENIMRKMGVNRRMLAAENYMNSTGVMENTLQVPTNRP